MSMDRGKVLEVLQMVYPFHRKTEQELREVLAGGDVKELRRGEFLYRKGENPAAFFIVLSGKVRLVRTGGGVEPSLVELSSGDFLGFELFIPGERYRASAAASEDAVILVFRKDRLGDLIRTFPWFRQGLQTLLESFRQASGVHLDWMGEDETVYFISRRHSAFLFIKLILPTIAALAFLVLLVYEMLFAPDWQLPGILFACGLILAGLVGAWLYQDWTNDYSIITNQRVVFQEKVVLLYDSRQEAPMNAVLKVDTSTSLLGRWLGYGDVIASTYAGVVILHSLNRPEEAAALLLSASERATRKRKQIEKKEVDALLRDRLTASTPPGGANPSAELPLQITPGKIQVLLSNMFRMRFEEGPNITYRTHWFILFLKLLIPSVLWVALVILWLVQPGFLQVLPQGGANIPLILLSLGAAGAWIYQYVDWRNDYYQVTLEQVVDVYKKPLGREERQAAPLKNIQSIEFRRKGVIGLLLNYGTVFIRVGDFELTFNNVFNPAEIQRDLFHRIAERDFREKQEALGEERERLADWIEAYHHIQQEARDNPESPAPLEDLG